MTDTNSENHDYNNAFALLFNKLERIENFLCSISKQENSEVKNSNSVEWLNIKTLHKSTRKSNDLQMGKSKDNSISQARQKINFPEVRY